MLLQPWLRLFVLFPKLEGQLANFVCFACHIVKFSWRVAKMSEQAMFYLLEELGHSVKELKHDRDVLESRQYHLVMRIEKLEVVRRRHLRLLNRRRSRRPADLPDAQPPPPLDSSSTPSPIRSAGRSLAQFFFCHGRCRPPKAGSIRSAGARAPKATSTRSAGARPPNKNTIRPTTARAFAESAFKNGNFAAFAFAHDISDAEIGNRK